MTELNNELEEQRSEEKKLVKQILIDALSPLEYPVRLQGSLLEDEAYPESFFTYWLNESKSDKFYSNSEGQVIWHFDLNFYSSLPADEIEDIVSRAKTLLKEEGFIVKGLGFDLPSDEPTHTGRGLNVIYIENI